MLGSNKFLDRIGVKFVQVSRSHSIQHKFLAGVGVKLEQVRLMLNSHKFLAC